MNPSLGASLQGLLPQLPELALFSPPSPVLHTLVSRMCVHSTFKPLFPFPWAGQLFLVLPSTGLAQQSELFQQGACIFFWA